MERRPEIFHSISAADFIDAANKWARLGWSVHGQASDYFFGDGSDNNPNAMRQLARFLDDNGFEDEALDVRIDYKLEA